MSDPIDIERFHPLGSRVFVKPDKPQDKVGSLFIPDNAKKPADTGVVVAMGPGMLCKDGSRWAMPDVRIGDHVIYSGRTPFIPVKIGDLDVLSMHDDDILAVVEE
jgi:co-chaperonin GroES (HSP10)